MTARRVQAAVLAGMLGGIGATSIAWAAKHKPAEPQAAAEPAEEAPAVFTQEFARALSKKARHTPLTLTDLRKAAHAQGTKTETTEYVHYNWINENGACHSSMGADIAQDGDLHVLIATPDDVTIQLDRNGTMQCSPVACAAPDAMGEFAPSGAPSRCR